MFEIKPTVETRKVEPYKRLHVARFRTGIHNLFDTLRYDHAFFARKSDVDILIESVERDGERVILGSFSLLIAQYAESRPGWTYAKLLHDQQLDELDGAALYDLHADFTDTRPKGLKHCNTVTVTGTFRELVLMMHANRAIPDSEKDAHILESAPYHNGEQLTVTLRNYSSVPGVWRF